MRASKLLYGTWYYKDLASYVRATVTNIRLTYAKL